MPELSVTETKKKGGLSAAFSSAISAVFPLYDPEDNNSGAITFESGNSIHNRWSAGMDLESGSDTGSTVSDGKPSQRLHINKLPSDRFLRYRIYKEMSEDSTIHTALELHLAHALSVDNKSGQIVYLEPKSDEDAEYVEQLNKEVMTKINENITSWAWPMCVFGVGYVRPYAEIGRGIYHWESNYYTLPNNIREYERAGVLVGFTSEELRTKPGGEQVRLAEPWTLIPLKNPIWRPDMDIEPVNYSGQAYSLYSDIHTRYPIETQNYGTSLLYAAYESWLFLRNAIRSLAKSRQLASIIDRLISVDTNNLDAARAAEYLRLIASQIQEDRDDIERQAKLDGYLPVVINSLIPIMSGGAKGGVNIDTFSVDPNIAHIEDIMFHVKRLAGALGVEPSMLGFSDMLSGGLGEGGFFRTAIQSAMRANQIRLGVVNFVKRSIDIHTSFRDEQAWPDGEEPFYIRFNSLNTAIEIEAADARESKANYAMTVATLLDMFEQSTLSKSDTLKRKLYGDVLEGLSNDEVDVILEELAKETADAVMEDDMLMESLRIPRHNRNERYIRDIVLQTITDFLKVPTGEDDE
ncbi:TPA: hypothetical protein ACVU5P_004241 [Vibrio parahaemolyticus]